jgi:ribosomal peptide maturation radical SAM protein 1
MRVALVSMPWASHARPSAALGILKAVVGRDLPDLDVDCRYPNIDLWARLGPVYTVLSRQYRTAELVYAASIYPDMERGLRNRLLIEWAGEVLDEACSRHTHVQLVEHVFSTVRDELDATIDLLATGYDVVGFTTSHCQLFASLAAGRGIKKRNPEVRIVLGGPGVAGAIGRSLLGEYGFLDFVVEGEGEVGFVQLLEELRTECGSPGAVEGVRSRSQTGGELPVAEHAAGSTRLEVEDLDALPVPDYTDFEHVAERNGIIWRVPIEGSRGCWWNRITRTGNPKHACHFCGLVSCSYRTKGPERIADELGELGRRHRNVRFRFADNVNRSDGAVALADAIESQGLGFRFYMEIRANISPYELLRLWEAGCDRVQLGTEGFSSSYLSRIGKGTTTIQNLQVLKTCCELGIGCNSNLLTGFPGATAAEVDETVRNIERFAMAYPPSKISRFRLTRPSSIFMTPDEFGVSNIRNDSVYRLAIPPDVLGRLSLFWLEFDCAEPTADWSAVESAVEEWQSLHERLAARGSVPNAHGVRALTYHDGGEFCQIEDLRNGFREAVLEGPWREIYMYCLEIRRVGKVLDHLGGTVTEPQVKRILDTLVEHDLMFRENGECLSLALARDSRTAADRIRRSE